MAYYCMTWGEFKAIVDKLVKDDERLNWIDWSGEDVPQIRRRTPHGEIEIT